MSKNSRAASAAAAGSEAGSACGRAVGPAGAGVASSFSTVPDSRTPLKYRSLERFFVAEESEKSGAASGPNQRERSPAPVTNPSARTQAWSAAWAQPVPKPSRG